MAVAMTVQLARKMKQNITFTEFLRNKYLT